MNLRENRRQRTTGRRASDLVPWYRRYISMASMVLAMLLAVIVFTGLLFWAGVAIDEAKCEVYGDQTGRDTKYVFMVGCMIKIPGGWIPKEELRQVQRLNP